MNDLLEKASTSSSCQNEPRADDDDCMIVSVFTPKEKRHRQVAAKFLSPRKKSSGFNVPTSKWSDSRNRGKRSTEERDERVNDNKKLKKYMTSGTAVKKKPGGLQRERIVSIRIVITVQFISL